MYRKRLAPLLVLPLAVAHVWLFTLAWSSPGHWVGAYALGLFGSSITADVCAALASALLATLPTAFVAGLVGGPVGRRLAIIAFPLAWIAYELARVPLPPHVWRALLQPLTIQVIFIGLLTVEGTVPGARLFLRVARAHEQAHEAPQPHSEA